MPAIKLAVLGDPIAHSRSPEIHRQFAGQFGLDIDYQRLRTPTDRLAEQLAAFAADGGSGANLTVPLKEAGLRLCEELDEAAVQAGAVNTLKRINGHWQGFNTDGGGLLMDLARLGIDVRGARILVLGAGGATAGILGPLLAAQPAHVHLINRNTARAEALASRFVSQGNITAGSLAEPGSAALANDLILQATSLGHSGICPPLKVDWLKSEGVVYDLNYGSAFRPVAEWCAAQRRGAFDGLGMLVGQAALAFEIWTGQRPAITPVIDALTQSA